MVWTTKTRFLLAVADCFNTSQADTMTLSAVSHPKLYSVPGTLLLIVAATWRIGIRNAGYFERAPSSIKRLSNASNPPITSRP